MKIATVRAVMTRRRSPRIPRRPPQLRLIKRERRRLSQVMTPVQKKK
jgi:hypothetical protein